MDTSLIINATNGNKKVTKAITNINPVKDNQTLKTFAQMVNGLSSNTYVDATRINKQSVNEQDSGFTVSTSETAPTGYSNYVTISGGVRLNFTEGYIDVTVQ